MPFKCSYCGLSLRVSNSYLRRFLVASYLLAALCSYALDARGYAFMFAFLIGSFSFFFVLTLLGRFFDPPKLRVNDDYSLNLNSRDGR